MKSQIAECVASDGGKKGEFATALKAEVAAELLFAAAEIDSRGGSSATSLVRLIGDKDIGAHAAAVGKTEAEVEDAAVVEVAPKLPKTVKLDIPGLKVEMEFDLGPSGASPATLKAHATYESFKAATEKAIADSIRSEKDTPMR